MYEIRCEIVIGQFENELIIAISPGLFSSGNIKEERRTPVDHADVYRKLAEPFGQSRQRFHCQFDVNCRRFSQRNQTNLNSFFIVRS